MTKEEFVEIVKLQTSDSAVSGTIKTLTRPPGRKPSPRLVLLSTWYNQLSAKDQAMLAEALKESAEAAMFGLFCILDGVRSIENGPDKGELEMYLVRAGEKTLLNDPRQEELHNMFNASCGSAEIKP
jgi:hypothetical protein